MSMSKEELEKFFEQQKEKFGERYFNKNNKVVVKGELTENFTFSHERCGIKFYKNIIRIQRYSGSFDSIPLIVSEKYLDLDADYADKVVEIRGSFRSCNDRPGHLKLYLYAKDLLVSDDVDEKENNNQIYIEGYICKEVVYRETPLGKEICDLFIAVNRAMGYSDYIPCIAWGTKAKEASSLKIGDRIRCYGRIQSREYEKVIEGSKTGEKEKRQTYEISISGYEVVNL